MIRFLVLFLTCHLALTVDAQPNEKESSVVTLEDFGGQSGVEAAADSNSVALQRAIDHLIKTGQKLISRGDKKYYISKGVKIKAPILIDFNRATLIATDTISIITIENSILRRCSGKISGLRLDLNNKAKRGIDCVNSIKLHISDCEIVNIPQKGVALNIEKGYEIFVDNTHVLGGQNGATGFRIRTSDCHFTDCVMIDCHTAVDCNGSNFYERIHAWMGAGGRWLDGSTFFRVAGGGPNFLNQCFSDTFEKSFEITSKTSLYISQHKNFHNKIMWKRDVNQIHPEMFHFVDKNVAYESSIFINSSYIGGLRIDNVERQVFSNIEENVITVSNSIINK